MLRQRTVVGVILIETMNFLDRWFHRRIIHIRELLLRKTFSNLPTSLLYLLFQFTLKRFLAMFYGIQHERRAGFIGSKYCRESTLEIWAVQQTLLNV